MPSKDNTAQDPGTDPRTQKRALRADARRRRRALDQPERHRAALGLAETLRRRSLLGRARTVALYAPIDGEIDPNLILDTEPEGDASSSTTYCWPRTFEGGVMTFHLHRGTRRGYEGASNDSLDSMDIGRYGVREPSGDEVDPGRIDLVLVPGVLFSRRGERLGMGAGYYDRFLSKNPDICAIGVAYGWQVLDALPQEQFDVPLSQIATPSEFISIETNSDS